MKDKLKKIFKREEKEETPEARRRKAIIFFGFYLIFFIVLFIYIRSFDNQENPKEDSVLYKTELIENGTYSYAYTITENDNTFTFQGSTKNDNYELSEYKYKQLLDIYNIKKILKNSKYILKEESGTGLINYRYEITSNALANLLNINIMNDDSINPIIVYVDKDRNIYKIEMDFSNYMKVSENYDIYKLTIEYGAFENEENSAN